MKWKKLGKIFDPKEHLLPNNCSYFAQSPQALVLEDRVRVYFSTREKDNLGKYLSHVAFVDFDISMQNILDISNQTVIELGGLGCFDEHGIFPFNVTIDGDRVLAYTAGWNRKVSVSVDASIGFAISNNDGLTFQKHGNGPIMAASLNEPFLIGDPFVTQYEGQYHMWYIFGSKWKKYIEDSPPDRVYKIAHATSTDGINWQRDGKQIISDHLNTDECQALPTVIYLNDIYHMYFCYRQADGFRTNTDRAYRIGYAWSNNLTDWKRDDGKAGIDISKEGWDSEMMCYPHLFKNVDGNVYLLYNGNEFGRYGFGLAILDET
jgi:predicted GH43/DUF377 family glycosyl hydrolase